MVEDKYKPYGSGTIEGAFLNDLGHAFDSDEPVTVAAGDREPVEIKTASVDLERNQISTKTLNGTEHAVAEIHYRLTVPIELAVASGDDVVVDGFEADWTFPDVVVERVRDEQTSVVAEIIDKDYGETDDPF